AAGRGALVHLLAAVHAAAEALVGAVVEGDVDVFDRAELRDHIGPEGRLGWRRGRALEGGAGPDIRRDRLEVRVQGEYQRRLQVDVRAAVVHDDLRLDAAGEQAGGAQSGGAGLGRVANREERHQEHEGEAGGAGAGGDQQALAAARGPFRQLHRAMERRRPGPGTGGGRLRGGRRLLRDHGRLSGHGRLHRGGRLRGDGRLRERRLPGDVRGFGLTLRGGLAFGEQPRDEEGEAEGGE